MKERREEGELELEEENFFFAFKLQDLGRVQNIFLFEMRPVNLINMDSICTYFCSFSKLLGVA